MALWLVSNATSPIIVIVYDISIVIVYDVTLLLSTTYQFQSRSGKNWLHGSMGNKSDKPSIAIYQITGSPLDQPFIFSVRCFTFNFAFW